MAWFSRRKAAALPLVSISRRNAQSRKAAAEYLQAYLVPSAAFGDVRLNGLIPDRIAEITADAPMVTEAQARFIEQRIRTQRTIPSLAFLSPEVQRLSEERIWWLVPGVVIANKFFSWIAVATGGIYGSSPENENDGVGVVGWDEIRGMKIDVPEPGCCRLRISTSGSTEVRIAELSTSDRGSSLRIIKAIFEVLKPTIDAHRTSNTMILGTGGERYVAFDGFDELLDETRWAGAPRPSDGSRTETLPQSPSTVVEPDADDDEDDGDDLPHTITYIMACMAMIDRTVTIQDKHIYVSALQELGLADSEDDAMVPIFVGLKLREKLEEDDQWLQLFQKMVKGLPNETTYHQRLAILEQVKRLQPDDALPDGNWLRIFDWIADWWKDDDDSDDGTGTGIPALTWEPHLLTAETDPPYPGDYFRVPTPLASKNIRVTAFPALARARELFPEFTASDVDVITAAIRATNILPRLTFVRSAMTGVFAYMPPGADAEKTAAWQDIADLNDAIWFMPAVMLEEPGDVSGTPITCALWLCEQGLKMNLKKDNVLSSVCWSTDIISMVLFEDEIALEHCPGCATLTIDCCGDDVSLAEAPGPNRGCMLKILEACWDVLTDTVIDPSQDGDEWNYDEAEFMDFENWAALREWAGGIANTHGEDVEEEDHDDAAADVDEGDNDSDECIEADGETAPNALTISLPSDTPGEFVDAALDLLSGGSALRTSPREIFGWFGYAKRGVRTIAHVASVIDAAKLETFPAITDGAMDSPIQLRLRSRVTPGRYTIALGEVEDETEEPDNWVSDDRLDVIIVPRSLHKAMAKTVRQIHVTGRPKRVVVRELLMWFGQQRRGPRVQATIAHALAQARLEAFPDPAFAHIDSPVELTLMPGVAAGDFTVEHVGLDSPSADNARQRERAETAAISDGDANGAAEAAQPDLPWLSTHEAAAWIVNLARFLRKQQEHAEVIGMRARLQKPGASQDKNIVNLVSADSVDEARKEYLGARAWFEAAIACTDEPTEFWVAVSESNEDRNDGCDFKTFMKAKRKYINGKLGSQGVAFTGIGRSKDFGTGEEDVRVVLYCLPRQLLYASADLKIAPMVLAAPRDIEEVASAVMLVEGHEIFARDGAEALRKWAEEKDKK